MYPELEIVFPAGDVYDKSRRQKTNYRNSYCEGIMRVPRISHQVLGKVQNNKLGNRKTYALGQEWKTTELCIVMSLLALFVCSFVGIIFMWYTDGFNNLLYSRLIIKEESVSFEMWKKPPPKALVKVYIFNYTNVDEYEEGTADKLHLEEKGPYVYEESMERVNVKFNGSFVSYQIKRGYKFMPELSKGRQNDRVVVPNLLTLSSAAMNRHSNFLTKVAISQTLSNYNYKVFMTLPADRFIMGYEDPLYAWAKTALQFQNKKFIEKLGLLTQKNGLQQEVFTMHTGLNDISQIGKIVAINGKNMMNYWSTDDCNRIDGSDGSMFSPKSVSRKKPLRLFSSDMCRTFDLNFKEENTILNGDIPSYKYVLPDDVFDSPDNLPRNQCFCDIDAGSCPIQGLYNLTFCTFDSPTFVSFPHFYRGDKSLFDHISGLNPNASRHETSFELHPTMGFPMSATSKLQINTQILKSSGFNQLTSYQDNTVLPLVWIDMTLEDKTLPEDMIEIIKQATFTVKMIERILKYGSILMAIVTIIPIILNIKSKWGNKKNEMTSCMIGSRKETDC